MFCSYLLGPFMLSVSGHIAFKGDAKTPPRVGFCMGHCFDVPLVNFHNEMTLSGPFRISLKTYVWRGN
jgi:hypothetical protein